MGNLCSVQIKEVDYKKRPLNVPVKSSPTKSQKTVLSTPKLFLKENTTFISDGRGKGHGTTIGPPTVTSFNKQGKQSLKKKKIGGAKE